MNLKQRSSSIGILAATSLLPNACNTPEQQQPSKIPLTKFENTDIHYHKSNKNISHKNINKEITSRKTAITKNTQKEVYITIDDGPSQRTQDILDTLKNRNLKATFFRVWTNIKASTKQLADQIHTDGHALGSHSYSHAQFANFTNIEEAKKEINKTDSIIKTHLDQEISLFRYPYGAEINANFKEEFNAFLAEKGYKPPIFWTIDTKDRSTKSTHESIKAELLKIKAWDVILIHEKGKTARETIVLIDSILNEKKLKTWIL